MAAVSIGYGVIPNFSVKHSQFLSFSSSSLSLPTKILLHQLQINKPTYQKSRSLQLPISSIQSNFFKVIYEAYFRILNENFNKLKKTYLLTIKASQIGKNGVEAGTNIVPDAVPRPVARLSVTVVATALSLFILRSLLSTVFFTLGVMGFVYFIYLALNKDKGPKLDEKPGSTDEAINQANKIMEKYK